MQKWLFSFCLFTLATASYAQQIPQFSLDSRVQTFNYTPEDVFLINTKFGHGSLIQFEAGEVIHDDGGLGVGEARDWSIAVKGNNVFFKPLQPYIAPTNMIIVTNKRTYAFAMQTTADDEVMTYVAKFNYPEEMLASIQAPSAKTTTLQRVQQDGISYLIDAKINTQYFKRGNNELTPSAVWDDGLFTYLKYDNAKELPAVYKVMPDGSEALINTHIQDDTLIIHEVRKMYRLRLGRAVAELANGRYQDSGFNHTGTSLKNTVRIEQ